MKPKVVSKLEREPLLRELCRRVCELDLAEVREDAYVQVLVALAAMLPASPPEDVHIELSLSDEEELPAPPPRKRPSPVHPSVEEALPRWHPAEQVVVKKARFAAGNRMELVLEVGEARGVNRCLVAAGLAEVLEAAAAWKDKSSYKARFVQQLSEVKAGTSQEEHLQFLQSCSASFIDKKK